MSFLPERRFRARTAQINVLLMTLACACDFFYVFHFAPESGAVLWAGGLLTLCIGALLAIFLLPSYERTLGLFLLALMIFISSRDAILAPTALHTTIFFFPLFILLAFLLCDRRWALIVSTWGFVQASAVLFYCRFQAFDYHHFLSFDASLDRRLAYLLLANLMTYLGMLLDELFHNRRLQSLMQEKDWFLHSSKMQELASLIQATSIQLTQPLLAVQNKFPELIRLNEADPQKIALVDQHMQELLRISRSISWLYQSQRSSEAQCSIGEFQEQLRTLLGRRLADRSWVLELDSESTHLPLKGPLLSLMLLLISLAQNIGSRYVPRSRNTLRFRLSPREGFIYGILSWPPDARLRRIERGSPEELEEQIREALIAELARECHAVLQETERAGQCHILLLKSNTNKEVDREKHHAIFHF